MELKDVIAAQNKYRSKLVHIIIIGILLIIYSIGVYLLSPKIDSPLEPISLVLEFVLFFSWVVTIIFIAKLSHDAKKLSSVYKKTYKAYFVAKSLTKTFTDVQYNHEHGLAKEALSYTQMVDTGDRYSSNDLTTGKYKDVSFTQADIDIQQKVDVGDSSVYTSIFKGRIMIYEFPKPFSFRLEVVEKGFKANRIPGNNAKNGRKFEKIELESSEFNAKFNAYAEDGFEAFYLLDPNFIQGILNLGKEHKGKILLCFLENKLVVGLKDGKDAFEPPFVFKSIDEKTETERVAGEIRPITNYVDMLKLDRRLFD